MGNKKRLHQNQSPPPVETGKWSTRWKLTASFLALLVPAIGIFLVWKNDRDNRLIEVQKQVVEAQRHIMEVSNQLVKASDTKDDDAYQREIDLKTQEMAAAQKTYKIWEEKRAALTGTKPEPFELKLPPNRPSHLRFGTR